VITNPEGVSEQPKPAQISSRSPECKVTPYRENEGEGSYTDDADTKHVPRGPEVILSQALSISEFLVSMYGPLAGVALS
jgi:hypothetical protein